LLPTIYQAINGFRAQDRKVINKFGLQSAGMQVIGTVVGFVLYNMMNNEFKMIVLYTGVTFLLCIGLLVMIQNLLVVIKQK